MLCHGDPPAGHGPAANRSVDLSGVDRDGDRGVVRMRLSESRHDRFLPRDLRVRIFVPSAARLRLSAAHQRRARGEPRPPGDSPPTQLPGRCTSLSSGIMGRGCHAGRHDGCRQTPAILSGSIRRKNARYSPDLSVRRRGGWPSDGDYASNRRVLAVGDRANRRTHRAVRRGGGPAVLQRRRIHRWTCGGGEPRGRRAAA
jgi:hypothetical protein